MTDKLSTSEQDPPQQMKSFKNSRFRNHPALEILTVSNTWYCKQLFTPTPLLFLLGSYSSPKNVQVIQKWTEAIMFVWQALHTHRCQIIMLCSCSVGVPWSPSSRCHHSVQTSWCGEYFWQQHLLPSSWAKPGNMSYCNSLESANRQGHWCSFDFCPFVVSWLFLLPALGLWLRMVQRDLSCCCCYQRSWENFYHSQCQGESPLSGWALGGSCVTSLSGAMHSDRVQV